MKPTFKTTTHIAAIGMIVYTLYIAARFLIHLIHPMPYHYVLWEDICERLILDILPLSLMIAGIGLWNPSTGEAPQPPKGGVKPVEVSKPFRILTLCLLAALGCTLILSPLYVFSIAGVTSLFPPFLWRVVLMVAGIIWLFMLGNRTPGASVSRPFRVTLAIAMALLALPVILEAISGIALLCGNETVLGLRSGVIQTWVKYIAPILPLALVYWNSHKH